MTQQLVVKPGKSSNPLKNFRRRITYSEGFLNFAAALAYGMIRSYMKTLRVKVEFGSETEKLDLTQVVFGFWHGRQFLMLPVGPQWNMAILSDISWAGEIQARILKKLGYHVVRGSSKKKPARALLSVKKAIEAGCSAGFALDGPSGPIYESKPGVIFLAQKFNRPLIPVTASASRGWIIKNTWCRYLLPKPFSVCKVIFHNPLTIHDDFDSKELDALFIQKTEEIDQELGFKQR